MPTEFYLWIIIGVLASGFVGAILVLWRHDCGPE